MHHDVSSATGLQDLLNLRAGLSDTSKLGEHSTFRYEVNIIKLSIMPNLFSNTKNVRHSSQDQTV
jgi:hypothetical protein